MTARRLTPEEAAAVLARAEPLVEGGPARTPSRSAVDGVDPSGKPIHLELQRPTAVLFLSPSCDGCHELAAVVREGVEGFDVLGVLRAPIGALPDQVVDDFVGDAGVWVLGDDPFSAFDVRSAPFFCVLDDSGAIAVEGVAFGRSHLVDHCRRVAAGAARPDAIRLTPDPHS